MTLSPDQLDPKFAEILASLPAKASRSRLEPYRELIREMRRRGRTYREIAGVLGERCGVRVAVSSVHEFVRRRSKVKSMPSSEIAPPTFLMPASAAGQEPQGTASPADSSELRQKIEALKQRAAPSAAAGPAKPVFTYNENEPLRVEKAGKR